MITNFGLSALLAILLVSSSIPDAASYATGHRCTTDVCSDNESCGLENGVPKCAQRTNGNDHAVPHQRIVSRLQTSSQQDEVDSPISSGDPSLSGYPSHGNYPQGGYSHGHPEENPQRDQPQDELPSQNEDDYGVNPDQDSPQPTPTQKPRMRDMVANIYKNLRRKFIKMVEKITVDRDDETQR